MELVLAAIVMRKEKNELEYKTHQLMKEKPAEVLIGQALQPCLQTAMAAERVWGVRGGGGGTK